MIDLQPEILLFKAARLTDPKKVAVWNPSLQTVDELSCLAFVSPTDIEELKSELPTYYARAQEVSSQIDVLKMVGIKLGKYP